MWLLDEPPMRMAEISTGVCVCVCVCHVKLSIRAAVFGMPPVASFYSSRRWMNTGVKVLQLPWVLLPPPPSFNTTAVLRNTVFISHTFPCEYLGDVSFYMRIWPAPCVLYLGRISMIDCEWLVLIWALCGSQEGGN